MFITPYEKYLIYLSDNNLSLEEQAEHIEKFAKEQMKKDISKELKMALQPEANDEVRRLYAKCKFFNRTNFETEKEKMAVLIFAFHLFKRLKINTNEILDMFGTESDAGIEELPLD